VGRADNQSLAQGCNREKKDMIGSRQQRKGDEDGKDRIGTLAEESEYRYIERVQEGIMRERCLRRT